MSDAAAEGCELNHPSPYRQACEECPAKHLLKLPAQQIVAEQTKFFEVPTHPLPDFARDREPLNLWTSRLRPLYKPSDL